MTFDLHAAGASSAGTETAPDPIPRPHHGARRLLSAIGLAVAVTAFFFVWLAVGIGGTATVSFVDDLVTVLAALTAAVLCIRASLRSAGRLKLFWALLGAASIAWTIAETVWAVYDRVLGEPVPIPSWADVGYLSAIPLAVAALLCHPAHRNRATRQARATLDGMMVATAVLYLSWSLVLGPLWRTTDLSTIGGVIAVAYPFGDIVIVFLIVQAMRSMVPGDRLALLFVLLGLLAMAISDSTYTYMSEVASYSTGKLIDTGWVAAYMGIALGAFFADAQPVTATEPALPGAPSLLSLVTPYLTVLGALAVIGIEIEVGRRLNRVDWLMALALVFLVIARHGLMLFDSRSIERDHLGGVDASPSVVSTRSPS